ncbi:MAG TPA: MotA/TolQ/ExbB proton channel family protein [Blastocatellia bacterium]|nr:MotA/TolQ/ExbB proton channel family protein [Blastocatellia bacterium]
MKKKKRADFSVVIGLLIGLAAIVICAVLEGIKLTFLLQPTAALVVFGGTLGAVIVRRGVNGLKEAAKSGSDLFFHEQDDKDAILGRLIWMARAARHEGVKAFETNIGTIRDPLVTQALSMAADYAKPADVRIKLDRILEAEDERGISEVATFDAAGGYAPTFGIIGAVLGLIYVLRSIADPGSLGQGIATAFVATIYGVGAANLVFFPIASRLRDRHRSRMRHREMLAEALVALAAHESPHAIAASFSGPTTIVGSTESYEH